MKILVNGFAARTGGPETFLLNLLAHLAPIDPLMEYIVLVPENRLRIYDNLPENVVLESIKEDVASSVFKRLVHEHITIPLIFSRKRCSIYLQADELLSPVVGLSGIPSVIVFHATQHMLIPESVGDSKIKLFYLNWIKRLAMKYALIPVTVSHHAKGELSGLYPHSRDKIQVVYHGIDFNQFKPIRSGESIIGKRYGIKNYILSVSNRHVFKNYYNLVRTYHLLCKQHDIEEHLVIVGGVKSLYEEDRIKKYVNDNQLKNQVHLIEYIDQNEIASVYQFAKAYIFPSTFETFGFTPLEAMACGLPCACSRFSCLPEICGDAAEYFDPLDIDDMARAMKTVLFNEDRRQELIDWGLRHVKQFSWHSAALKYHKLIMGLSDKKYD